MKKYILLLTVLFSSSLSLNASGLENMLKNGDMGKHDAKNVRVITYYIIPLSYTKSVFYESKTTMPDGSKVNAPIAFLGKNIDRYNMEEKEDYFDEVNKISSKAINELKVGQYIIGKIKYLSSDYNEKVVVSFIIDDARNITNINFIEPSIEPEVTRLLEKSIYDARFDFIKKKDGKEKITLHFNFVH